MVKLGLLSQPFAAVPGAKGVSNFHSQTNPLYYNMQTAAVNMRASCVNNPTVACGDSLDWKNLPPEEISDRVLKKVKPGSIVLFHNAALHTPEALPTILEKLQQNGYEVVPVSQLIIRDNFHIDTSGMQIPNAEEKADEVKNGAASVEEKSAKEKSAADVKEEKPDNNSQKATEKGKTNEKSSD